MNKDEILEKSRQENKSQDLYEKEVAKHAGKGGTIAAAFACFILIIVDLFFGQNVQGLMAIMMATLAGEFFAKGIKFKRRGDIAVGVFCGLVAIFSLVVHIFLLSINFNPSNLMG
jgi:phosphatidylserine synthase